MYTMACEMTHKMIHLSLEGAIRHFWQMGPEKDIANRRMSADHEIMRQQYICFKSSK